MRATLAIGERQEPRNAAVVEFVSDEVYDV